MLNLDSDAPDQDVQQVSPVARSFAELHLGIGVNLESAAIGKLKQSRSIRAGDDELLNLDGLPRGDGPQGGIAHDRNASGNSDRFGGIFGGIDAGKLTEAHDGG